MNIEYNVWLGHDSTTLCDSTRLDSRPLWLVTWLEHWSQWLVTRLGLDPHDSWLDSGLVPSDSSTALIVNAQGAARSTTYCSLSALVKTKDGEPNMSGGGTTLMTALMDRIIPMNFGWGRGMSLWHRCGKERGRWWRGGRTKCHRTKCNGQNVADKMLCGQNVIGQNVTDKMSRTKRSGQNVVHKMSWTKCHGQKVVDNMSWTKWYGQNVVVKMFWSILWTYSSEQILGGEWDERTWLNRTVRCWD